jgi:hypothetical protein
MQKIIFALAFIGMTFCAVELAIGLPDKSLNASQAAVLVILFCVFLLRMVLALRKNKEGLKVLRKGIQEMAVKPAGDQSVMVHLKLGSDFGEEEVRTRIFELEERLERLVGDADVGIFDGDEFGNGDCTLFFYGGNADKLYAAIEPTLLLSPLSKGGHVVKDYGDGNRPRESRVNF